MGITRVLIIKIAALGDIVDASTLIAEIKKEYPSSHITWVCAEDLKSLVSLFKGVDKIITIDRNLLKKGFFSRVRCALSLISKIALRRYDLCVVAQQSKYYNFFCSLTLSKKRQIIGGRNGPLPARYRGNEYARLLSGSDFFSDRMPEFAQFDAPEDSTQGEILLMPAGAIHSIPYEGIRRWPVENYVELARILTGRGFEVGLIGDEKDKWAEEYFDGIDVISYLGKLSIPQLVAKLKGCRVLISHDSGPMHLCFALKKPLVAILGPTYHRECLPPERELIKVVKYDMPCSPCYNGTTFADCKEGQCMKKISVVDVLKAVDFYV